MREGKKREQKRKGETEQQDGEKRESKKKGEGRRRKEKNHNKMIMRNMEHG